jgi:hypothetical protein
MLVLGYVRCSLLETAAQGSYHARERERGRKYSRRVDQAKNNGKTKKKFIMGREKERNFLEHF